MNGALLQITNATTGRCLLQCTGAAVAASVSAPPLSYPEVAAVGPSTGAYDDALRFLEAAQDGLYRLFSQHIGAPSVHGGCAAPAAAGDVSGGSCALSSEWSLSGDGEDTDSDNEDDDAVAEPAAKRRKT